MADALAAGEQIVEVDPADVCDTLHTHFLMGVVQPGASREDAHGGGVRPNSGHQGR